MGLIRGSRDETYQQFKNRIFRSLTDLVREPEVESLSVVLTVKKPPLISVIPFKKSKMASISLRGSHPLMLENILGIPGCAGIYEVEEAIPVAYQKTWEDSETTPGVNLLTLFRQKRSIDYETFIRRWHHGHTPLSLRIHPLWNYNRNVVLNKKSDVSESWDGIVEEHFQTASDLLNPAKFFGNPLTMLYRMMQVYMDTRSFLDYPTMETYLGEEIHLKSHVR